MKRVVVVLLVVMSVLICFACGGDISSSLVDRDGVSLSDGYSTSNSGKEVVENKAGETKNDNAKSTKNAKGSKEIASRIKKIFEKEKVKGLMQNGGSSNVREFIINSFEKVGGNKLESQKSKFPDIPFDNLKFASDEDAYNWLANNMTIIVKIGVESGELDQETIDGINESLRETGESFTSINVSKNMSDADIEKLCIWWLDYFDRVFDNAATKENGDFAYAMGLRMFLGFLGIPS